MSKRFIRKIGGLAKNCPNPMLQSIEINQIKSLYQSGVPIKQIVAWNFTQNGTALLTTWDTHFLIKWDSYLRRQPYSQSTRARCPS